MMIFDERERIIKIVGFWPKSHVNFIESSKKFNFYKEEELYGCFEVKKNYKNL